MKTFGGWRNYTPGYLVSDDAEITSEILEQMLAIMGFASLESLRQEVGQYARGEFSSSLLAKLRLLLRGAGDKPTKDLFWMPDELSASVYNESTGDTETVDFKNPFALATNPSKYLVDIQALAIDETSDDTYGFTFRGGISCEKLFQSRTEALDPICELIASGSLSDIIDQGSEAASLYQNVKEWLTVDNGFDGEIGAELLGEIEFQCRMNNEYMGICTSGLQNADGEDVEFYADSSDEEKGFM